MDREQVNPELYTHQYFLADSEGHMEYEKGLDIHIHPKFAMAHRIARPSKDKSVLDIGCGRGELLYYCAREGARVFGIDYSRAAVEIANETIKKLPEQARSLARVELGDVLSYDFQGAFDIIFMIEVVEHMYDHQLAEVFKKVYRLLNDKGRLIIITPNYYYERYLSPLKRISNIPINLVKWPLRFLRGKYKRSDVPKVLRNLFRVLVDRGELNRMLHVNVSTPDKLRRLLADFDAQVTCEDHSKNILSLLMHKWWGRDIVVVAKKKKR